ncbi:methylosome subunit pICln-like [Tubulanus polymorphus]|uniref:methylosome subunit pICln-like n=1 Tax=Tubulanus polymorphus TaxID=672921 RepID=UPI003DA42378
MVLLANLMAPTEGICHTELNTEVCIGDRAPQQTGNGTMYITENKVCWVSAGGQGFNLEYPSIVLHAISKDTSSFPRPCLYLQVEGKLDAEGEGGSDSGQSSEGGAEEEDRDFASHTTDIRFIPQDQNALEVMYTTMCDCQALHPDPEDSLSGDDHEGLIGGDGDGGDFFTSPEDMVPENLTEEGRATLARLEAMLQAGAVEGGGVANGNHDTDEGMDVDDGQFEDASEGQN